MTTPLPDADAVRLAIRRRFFKYGPSVDEAMVIVRVVLEERDAEIERLRAGNGAGGDIPPQTVTPMLRNG